MGMNESMPRYKNSKHKLSNVGNKTQDCETKQPDNLCDFPDLNPDIDYCTASQSNMGYKTRGMGYYSRRYSYTDIQGRVSARFTAARRRNSTPIGQAAKMTKKQDGSDNCHETKIPENTPCRPDLITCVKNVATFLAEAAARNNKYSSHPAPSVEYIYGYTRFLFAILQLEPECCVYADIYLRRLLSNSKGALKIHPSNWHKILVGACLLASKYVDDMSMDNRDFAAALAGCSAKFLNSLEAKYLVTLNWKLHVPISEYTTRYFELANKQEAVRDWDVHFERVKKHFSVMVDINKDGTFKYIQS